MSALVANYRMKVVEKDKYAVQVQTLSSKEILMSGEMKDKTEVGLIVNKLT